MKLKETFCQKDEDCVADLPDDVVCSSDVMIGRTKLQPKALHIANVLFLGLSLDLGAYFNRFINAIQKYKYISAQ